MEALLNNHENLTSLSQKDNREIASGVLTIRKIVENKLHFNIPIYQRLYVWKVNQIRTLLEDIKNAFENDTCNNFFLGGVMLSNNQSGQLDLIDGQQRFTTLWLICDLLSEKKTSLKQFIYTELNEPRIYFSIREKAQQFLKDENSCKEFINEKGEISKGAEIEISEILPLIEGKQFISEILAEFQKDITFNIKDFASFIYTKLNLTYTFVPGSSDMNRVFEAMNNRGRQLEHHELLKSRMLEKIEEHQRVPYALLWDACSDMNEYIEKSIKDVASLCWKNLYANTVILDESEKDYESNIELENIDIIKILDRCQQENKESISLKDILGKNTKLETDAEKNNILENEYSSKSIRSIVTFPTFLLHVLRVYQLEHSFSVNDSVEVIEKKLLTAFNIAINFNTSEKVKNFITLLWKTRVYFDKYVIKWVYSAEEKDEYHDIETVQVYKSKSENGTDNISVQRVGVSDEYLKNLVKLQSMLYHSQEMTTQYWLTPFLFHIIKQKFTNQALLKKLEILETVLFYSAKNTSKLRERTFQIVSQDLSDELDHLVDTDDYLSQFKGAKYPNYIFYKLEYILWKNRIEICQTNSLNIERWNKYRLTAKNSVEHIFPQNQKQENKHIEYISSDQLVQLSLGNKHPIDDFGNLVLLSPGMNSEYSNMPYQQKKGKHDSKTSIDSLKSDLIFKNVYWDWSTVLQHRKLMVSQIESYIVSLKRD